ncbi:MAG TPA: catalase family peroxidase [Magnetospirillaceae bacterium]|nr:catalase family peroxidase [Magnetospirillaceae bacterium]
MNKRIYASLAVLAGFGLSLAAQAQDQPDPAQVVDTLEKLGGVHKGLRRNHARGSCAVGSFVGTPEGRKLSSSAVFSGKDVPVIARFSVAGPNPDQPDAAKGPRGLALQFKLPKDELQQTAMINVPIFPVSTPQGFYESLLINLPDPATGKPDPEKGKQFVGNHPEAKPFLDYMGSHNAPPAYTETIYRSLSAYKFINGKTETWVRWRFEPVDGEKFLTEDEIKAAPHDFLDQRLTERTKKGPVKFTMVAIIGQPDKGDSIKDPSSPWPKDRKEVKVGTLTLTKGGQDAKGTCEDINYDPNVASAGIEPSSDDQVLQYRSSAYAESFTRRESEK